MMQNDYNKFWSAAFDIIDDLIFILDKDFNLVKVNRHLLTFTGKNEKNIIGRKCYKLIHGIDAPPPDCPFLKTLKTKEEETKEICDSRLNRWFSARTAPIFNDSNKIIGSVHFLRDITERKKNEMKLTNNEAYFRALTENSSDMVIVVDKKGIIKFVSSSIKRFMGYEPGELIGKNGFDFIVPTDFPRAIYDFRKAVKTTEGSIANWFRVRHSDGSERILEGLGKNFLDNPTIAGFVMNVRDVTERKRAEQELYNLNQFCESIIDDANIWIDVLDTHANVVIWNKAAEKISGYSREEAAGHNKIWTWLYPDDSYRKEIVAKARAIIEKGEVIEGFETSIRCKDGERKIISWNSRNLLNETKEVIGSIAVGSDVSERRRAEEKLRESEEQLRAIFETAQDSIFIKDLSLRYIRVNPATKHLFGIPAAKLIGSSDEDIFGKEAARRIRKIDSRVLEGKIMEDEQARLIRGVSTVVHIIKTPLYDNKGKISGMCGIARDITERSKAEKELRDAYHKLKEAQQQLIQSGKMMAMGQLAAGISHEINQPLTGIKGFAQAVLTELDVNSPIREDIQKIVKQSDRIDRIISNVRLFAHKSKFKMEELDINKPIEDSLMLLSEQLRVHNIRLNKSLTPELPKIKADPNQLQQVFVNLITNARDAIDSLKSPGGGELLVKSSLSQDQKNIEVIFQDTGRGILKENLKNIFNPFFTTKSPYAGTGLGLSIVHRIIESHKGNIEVASKQGKGTMFRIILPAIKTREKIKINQDKKTRSNPAE